MAYNKKSKNWNPYDTSDKAPVPEGEKMFKNLDYEFNFGYNSTPYGKSKTNKMYK